MFASAIANAQGGRETAAAPATLFDNGGGGASFQPAPAAAPAAPSFTPAARPAADPFSNPAAFNAPAPSPFDAAPQGGGAGYNSPPSSGGDPFGNMMASVNANGHQVTTLFTPPPSAGYGGGGPDPFAAPAPAPAPASDPFAMRPAPAPAPANHFAPAAPVSDPFAGMQQQQAANPFAAAPPQQQQVSNPFA